jgi:FtsH-binding integral membrane protein
VLRISVIALLACKRTGRAKYLLHEQEYQHFNSVSTTTTKMQNSNSNNQIQMQKQNGQPQSRMRMWNLLGLALLLIIAVCLGITVRTKSNPIKNLFCGVIFVAIAIGSFARGDLLSTGLRKPDGSISLGNATSAVLSAILLVMGSAMLVQSYTGGTSFLL